MKALHLCFFLFISAFTVMAPAQLSITSDSEFKLQNASSTLMLGIAGENTAPGTIALQWYDNGTRDHLWQFIPAGAGQYKIKNVETGLLLGVSGASQANGAQILQWSDNGTLDHLWSIVALANGNYTIRNVNSGLYLESKNNDPTTNATIDQYASNGCLCQQWEIVDSGATSGTPSSNGLRFPYAVPVSPDPLLSNLTIPSTAPSQGMWSPVYSWPFNGLHVSVLPDGRLLTFGAPVGGVQVQDGRTLDIWNPKAGFTPSSHVTISNGQLVDSFCGTASLLPTGVTLVSGGASSTSGYTSFANTIVNGSASSTKASPYTLAAQRWYGTMMTLADGRQMMTGGGTPYAIVSGYANPSATEPMISETPEVFSPSTGWSSLFGANSSYAFGPINNRAWYPRQWVAPDGTVFGISTDAMWNLNPNGNGSLTQVGTFKTTVNNSTLPNVGPTSTAVMYDTGKILQVGGNGYNNGYASPSSPYATIFDITKSSTAPTITDTKQMNYARQWANSTVLPNGLVAVTGGTTYGDTAGNDAVYPAELWNPSTGTWTVGASAAIYRGYHSAVALLPDGVLFSDGGGAPGPVSNSNAEIYYPPYLFTTSAGATTLAVRPQLLSLSTSAPDYNTTLSAQVAAGNSISEVSLIGLSSVTHSFNTSQRRIKLPYTQSGSVLTMQVPNNNLLPPGYYLLTVLDQKRIPSPGVIVAMHATAPPSESITALLPVDGAVRSLQLAASPAQVIRHSNYLAYVNGILPQTNSTLDRDDSSFYTRAGNAEPTCYSFESKNYPGYFLRHNNYRLKLNQNDGSVGFAQDSTFCAVSGLSGTGVSLQPIAFPGYYIHMRSGTDVWIDQPDGTTSFNQSASFLQTEQYLPTDAALHAFFNYTLPGDLVRVSAQVAYLNSINSASNATDRADASWIIHPGNASSACYSFESSDNPGYYLRHYNFALRTDQSDGTAQFASDSTFCLNSGLAGSGVSLTAISYPTYYVRQAASENGQQLYLQQNDNTLQFQTDATFGLIPAP